MAEAARAGARIACARRRADAVRRRCARPGAAPRAGARPPPLNPRRGRPRRAGEIRRAAPAPRVRGSGATRGLTGISGRAPGVAATPVVPDSSDEPECARRSAVSGTPGSSSFRSVVPLRHFTARVRGGWIPRGRRVAASQPGRPRGELGTIDRTVAAAGCRGAGRRRAGAEVSVQCRPRVNCLDLSEACSGSRRSWHVPVARRAREASHAQRVCVGSARTDRPPHAGP